jgi:hypothetical protein
MAKIKKQKFPLLQNIYNLQKIGLAKMQFWKKIE